MEEILMDFENKYGFYKNCVANSETLALFFDDIDIDFETRLKFSRLYEFLGENRLDELIYAFYIKDMVYTNSEIEIS